MDNPKQPAAQVAGSSTPSRPNGITAPTTPNQQAPQQRAAPNPGRPQPNGVRAQAPRPGESAAKTAWRNGRPCSGRFRFPDEYGKLKLRMGGFAKDPAAERQFWDGISAQSGAFIPVPKPNHREAFIWGSVLQTSNARALLMDLLTTTTPAAPKKKGEAFAKIMSYSVSKEAQRELVERNDSMLQLLRRKPDSSINLPETMLFLWPTDELPLDVLGGNLEDLDPLRKEFGCYIYVYEEDPNYIRVDGYDHNAIVQIVHRLRAKWAELMANRHVKIKLYLVQPPSTNRMKDEIAVVKLPPNRSGFAFSTPVLFSAPNPPSLYVKSQEDRSLVRAKNEERLREAIQRSLQGLRFLRGHVRMRMNYGMFVLDDYKMPADSKPRYSFSEFRSMLFHAKTKGHLVPGLQFEQGDEDLLSRCAGASDVLAPYEATSQSLEDAQACYAVNFEFEGENAALLRLEAEFGRSGSDRSQVSHEVSQIRWVKPQGQYTSWDKRPPLQIGVVDFESSDWQLEIKALEFHDTDNISQSLRNFSYSIGFSLGATDGLRGEGRRRVTFSDAAPVSRLVEKTAVRYRLRGTKYILELARYDEYTRETAPPAPPPANGVYVAVNRMAVVPVTSWGASIYSQEWDNMLGQHASFRVGHAAEWSPSLNTFFPSAESTDPSDVRGFNKFVDLASGIAVLLGPAEKLQGNMPNGLHPKSAPLETNDGVKPNGFVSWADVVRTPETRKQ